MTQANPGEPVAKAEQAEQDAAVTAHAVEVIRRRPPLVEVTLDVTLRNPEAAARWFLLPRSLPASGKGGVDVLEVAAAEGEGRAVLGRFLGSGGFYGLLLPAGAVVQLKALPFEYWEEPPDVLRFTARVASELTLGGEPARAWFAADPTSDARVVAERYPPLSVHRTADGKEVPAALTGAREVSVEVALPPER